MFTGKSYNTLFDGGTISTQRRTSDGSYAVANASIGGERGLVSTLYVNNLTDERGTVHGLTQ